MIWVAGDLLNYFFGGGSVSFVAFSCGVLRFRVREQPELGAGVRYRGIRRVAHRRALRGNGLHRLYLLQEGLAGAGGLLPGIMLTQIGYVPNVVQSAGTVEGLRQLIFIYPSLLAVITIVAMGCFYNLNEKMYVRIVEEIELRKRTA